MPIPRRTVLISAVALSMVSRIRVAGAQDPCSEFDAYGDAINRSAKNLGIWLRDNFVDRDPLTLSPTEWREMADWHQAQVEFMGLQSTLGNAIADQGILAASAMQESIENAAATLDAAQEKAVATCPAFKDVYQRWDALDQQTATPTAATPNP